MFTDALPKSLMGLYMNNTISYVEYAFNIKA